MGLWNTQMFSLDETVIEAGPWWLHRPVYISSHLSLTMVRGWVPFAVYSLTFCSSTFRFFSSPHFTQYQSPHPTPPVHLLLPSPLRSVAHLISLQSVWLIYHRAEILNSLLASVLGGDHDFSYSTHTHTHLCHTCTCTLNHKVFWRCQSCID